MLGRGIKKTMVREILPKATVQPPLTIKNPMSKRGRKKSEKTSSKPVPPKQQSIVKKPFKKKKITGALREAVWLKTMGRTFEGKCPVVWCSNTITVFDFQSGHNVPESKGGATKLPNLIAICARCNFSMGNTYTIDEWNALHANQPTPLLLTPQSQSQPPPKLKPSIWQRLFSCFIRS